MITDIKYPSSEMNAKEETSQPRWQRILLLIFIGYELAGCLLGGLLLVAAPDGRYMDMPVDMMHGTFPDFMIPGIILIGLGILNTLAFILVLQRNSSDWIPAGLALGGLFVWFMVEIVIIKELHWLHAMWAIPVMLGLIMYIPLIALRHEKTMMQNVLLTCGILSSLWYVGINIFVPTQYEGYSVLTHTPSELSAIGAPTRILWNLLVMLYPILFAAFGWGLIQISQGNSKLKIVGSLIIVYCALNIYWPPMHMREVIAAGGGTLSDTLHIAWATMTITFMMVLMGFGAAALKKKFRLYTIITFVIFIIFGSMTFMESPNLEANLPTPLMGLWERINIAAFMVWVIVFATNLLYMETGATQENDPVNNYAMK